MLNLAKPDRFYWLVVGVAPVLLTGLLIFGSVRDGTAESKVAAELAQLTSAGMPINDRTLTHTTAAGSSRKDCQAWNEVISATLSLETQWWPYLDDVAELDAVVPQDEPWEAEPIMTEYTNQAAAIVARIQGIPDSSTPLWRLTVFDGWNTLLPQISDWRSVSTLLEREFRVAYHAGDSQRALSALELLSRIQRVSDAEHVLVSDLTQMAYQFRQDTLIRKSLAHEFWNDDQLTFIRRLLTDRKSLDQRWRDQIGTEYATVLSNLEATQQQTGVMQISQQSLLAITELFNSLRDIPQAGSDQHSITAEQLLSDFEKHGDQWSSLSITSMPLASSTGYLISTIPSFRSVAAAFSRRHREQDWTLCAIAIKQFQLRNNRFPTKLEQLAEVSLTHDQWLAIDSSSLAGQSFGYKVSDDQSAAILWTIEPGRSTAFENYRGELPPSEQPPTSGDQQKWQEYVETHEAIIR